MPSAPGTKADRSDPSIPAAQERWLIRTARNEIKGPVSREEVRAKILSGELQAQDEVCRANHFWIYLHERAELQKQLGVELPKSASGEEDTQTNTDSRKTPVLTGFEEGHDQGEAGTSMIPGSVQAKRGSAPAAGVSPSYSLGPHAHIPQVHVLGKMDRPSIWRGLIWFLLTVSLFLIYLVLRALRTGAMKAPF